MGGRDRRSLRQHRRDPTTRLTPPSAHDITTRRTAARQRQPAQCRTRAPSSTHPTQRCRRRHRHERPGLVTSVHQSGYGPGSPSSHPQCTKKVASSRGQRSGRPTPCNVQASRQACRCGPTPSGRLLRRIRPVNSLVAAEALDRAPVALRLSRASTEEGHSCSELRTGGAVVARLATVAATALAHGHRGDRGVVIPVVLAAHYRSRRCRRCGGQGNLNYASHGNELYYCGADFMCISLYAAVFYQRNYAGCRKGMTGSYFHCCDDSALQK